MNEDTEGKLRQQLADAQAELAAERAARQAERETWQALNGADTRAVAFHLQDVQRQFAEAQTRAEQMEANNESLRDALSRYHALMGNIHLVHPNWETPESRAWYNARKDAQARAQKILADPGAGRLGDAQLISAAPDLLAVCERILQKDGIAGVRGQLRAAVAKARGQETEA